MTTTEAPLAATEMIPGLPPACCTEGMVLMTDWVDQFTHAFARRESTRDAIEAETGWTDHQLTYRPPRKGLP
ncbi:hypothetical protein [Streptomyces decoyicus]|uniref:hypothetical protein n=1 Tax=Streptomyces decoyicus TaxID=249567 RepID=UPI0036654F36